MMNDKDEITRYAERFGLTRLTDHHLAQLAKAKTAADGLVDAVPRDLSIYDEPAHTFRAEKEAES